MTLWLIQPGILAEMKAAAARVPVEKIEAFYGDQPEEPGRRILDISGDTAKITVAGVLTNRPSYLARYYGGGNATYPEIAAAVALAEKDPRVKKLVLSIDSPGGTVAGMFKAMDALARASKPLRVVVEGTAASAAYGLASQATDGIYASHRSNMLGSVGVATTIYVWSDEVDIASTEAPNKRPDVMTEEGKAVVRKELDDLHALFAEKIAAGRKTTVANVNANFGRGGVFLADEALKNGMIDGIITEKPKDNGGKKAMFKTIEELKAEYPGLCAIIATDAAKAATEAERRRVSAHLVLGEASGALDVAIKAVKEGTEVDAMVQAEHAAAHMKRQTATDRSADANDNAPAADGVDTTPAAETDQADAVARLVAERVGVEVK